MNWRLGFLTIFYLSGLIINLQAQGNHFINETYHTMTLPAKISTSTPLKILSRYFNPNPFLRNNLDCSISADIQVTYQSFPPEAIAAFEYAVDIWRRCIVADIPIRIEAEFTFIPFGALGYTSIIIFNHSFPNAPQNNVWYPVALANQLAGSNLEPNYADIHVRLNPNVNWYYEPDGNLSIGQYDFITTVLHEIAHGLGIASAAMSDGTAVGTSILAENKPFAYDLFVENQFGQSILNFQDGTIELLNALTSGNIYFNGLQATQANNMIPVKLYSPKPWNQSGISHIDSIFEGTANALLTYDIDQGEVIHEIGTIGLNMLKDVGWEINEDCYPNYIYINKNYQGMGSGSILMPYQTLEAAHLNSTGGSSLIFTASGNHNETDNLLLNRRVLLKNQTGATVIIH